VWHPLLQLQQLMRWEGAEAPAPPPQVDTWGLGMTAIMLNVFNVSEQLDEVWGRELATLTNNGTGAATRPASISRSDIEGLPTWALSTAIMAGGAHVALQQLREGCLPMDQLPAGWEAVRFPGAAPGQAWADWACAPRNSAAAAEAAAVAAAAAAAAAASGSSRITRGSAQRQLQAQLPQAQPTAKETAAREQALALAAARQSFCGSSPAADELDLSLHWALGWCIYWQPEERPSMWQLLCWATGWLAEFEERVLPPPCEPLPKWSVVELLRAAAETAAQEG
jgi:hypothetical protein